MTTCWSSRRRPAASRAEVPANLDPSRRAARVTLEAAPATVLPGARGLLTDVARAVLAAEAAGIAAETTEQAAEYAKVAPAVRPPDRDLPGGQAPLREHAGRGRAGDRRRPGTRAGPGSAAVTSSATPRPSRRPWPCPPRSATPASTSRCTAGSGSPGSTTPTCTCAGPRPSPRSSTPSRPRSRSPTWSAAASAGPAAIDLPAEAEPIRAAIGPDVARLRELDGDAQEAGADRDRLRDAALAEAVGPGRGRHRAAGDRAGVRRGRDQAARPTASPAGSS